MRRCRSDRGSAAVEMVILAPVLVVLMLFVVFVGRAGGAIEQIRHAADAGARAASLVARTFMDSTARQAVTRDLDANGSNCASMSVSVGVAHTETVDTVTVTVSCVSNTAGTGLLPASARTLVANSTEVIDRYRAG